MKNTIEEFEHKLYEFLDDLNDFGIIHNDNLNGKAYEMYHYIFCGIDDAIDYLNKMKYELEKEGVI